MSIIPIGWLPRATVRCGERSAVRQLYDYAYSRGLAGNIPQYPDIRFTGDELRDVRRQLEQALLQYAEQLKRDWTKGTPLYTRRYDKCCLEWVAPKVGWKDMGYKSYDACVAAITKQYQGTLLDLVGLHGTKEEWLAGKALGSAYLRSFAAAAPRFLGAVGLAITMAELFYNLGVKWSAHAICGWTEGWCKREGTYKLVRTKKKRTHQTREGSSMINRTVDVEVCTIECVPD